MLLTIITNFLFPTTGQYYRPRKCQKHKIIFFLQTVNTLIIRTYFYSKDETKNKHIDRSCLLGQEGTRTCGMPFNNLITIAFYYWNRTEVLTWFRSFQSAHFIYCLDMTIQKATSRTVWRNILSLPVWYCQTETHFWHKLQHTQNCELMFNRNDHVIQSILFYWLCKQWLTKNKQLFLCKFQLFFHSRMHLVVLSDVSFWRSPVTQKAPSHDSNKSPTRCNNFIDSSLLSWRLFTAQHVSGILTPIIGSSTNAVVASGFTFVSWW